MISDACLAAAAPAESIADKVKSFILIADLKAKEGLTVADFGELFLALMHLTVDSVDTVEGSGADKKAIVVQALADLFDALADRAVPVYALPLWVLAKPLFRSFALSAASGSIEVVIKLVRKSK